MAIMTVLLSVTAMGLRAIAGGTGLTGGGNSVGGIFSFAPAGGDDEEHDDPP